LRSEVFTLDALAPQAKNSESVRHWRLALRDIDRLEIGQEIINDPVDCVDAEITTGREPNHNPLHKANILR
jgi:hypothetical protein